MGEAQAIRDQLDDCLRHYKRLTQREHELVYGLVQRMQHRMEVSEQERTALERTWARIGAGDCGRRD